MSKTLKMPHIKIKLFSSCIYCEKPLPFKASMKGKLLCSKRCLKLVNEGIFDSEFHYGEEDVCK